MIAAPSPELQHLGIFEGEFLERNWEKTQAANTNAGVLTAGLSTNVAYVCIPISTLTYISEADVPATSAGDVRPLMYSLNKVAYDYYVSLNATNRSAKMTIAEQASSDSSGNLVVQHSVRTTLSVGSITVTSE